jgi:hypothetical protein
MRTGDNVKMFKKLMKRKLETDFRILGDRIQGRPQVTTPRDVSQNSRTCLKSHPQKNGFERLPSEMHILRHSIY